MLTNERRYDIDWIRIFAILSVFVFHSLHFFVGERWHVNDVVANPVASALSGLIIPWLMPIIFIVSGASIAFALRPGQTGRFLVDKVKRLLVPLLFGIFFLSPPMIYMERVTHNEFSGSFFDFLPHYFNGLYPFNGGNFAWMGVHLWYLLVLLVYMLILLPVFLGFKSSFGQRAISALGRFFSLPGTLYLLVIPVIAVMSVLNPDNVGMRDMGGLPAPIYIFYLLYGFIIFSSRRIQQAIINQRYFALAAFGLCIAYNFLSGGVDTPAFGTAAYTGWCALLLFYSWVAMMIILGFGMRYLAVNHPALPHLNEAVLPFYMLHQPLLLGIGFFVIPLALPMGIKYLLITPLAFTLSVAIYELVVRRVNILRVCFGLKPARKLEAAVSTSEKAVGAKA